jgi:peptidoglycan hydrolase-like protein with peptidoglycan-binding domain
MDKPVFVIKYKKDKIIKEDIVFIRLLPIFIFAIVFSGCATTQMKAQNEQLESRVTELEKNQQAKDAEIVDLQYQVKDLSSKLDTSKSPESDQAAPEAQASAADNGTDKTSEVSENSQIIRVKVSPEKIQRALKSAGVYTGLVDGKIGPGTKEAIIEFQKSHGLKSDGVLGRRTWDALKTYLKS